MREYYPSHYCIRQVKVWSMIQLKDTNNWEITQDHPRSGRPRTAPLQRKLKPYGRGLEETHKKQ